MKIRVLVSCSSERIEFIDCIKRTCEEYKNEYKDELEYHFIPTETAPLDEKDRLDRMLSLANESDIIFMDVTPKRYSLNGKEEHLTNQGVLIEYGVLLAPSYFMRLCLFCEDSKSRSLLHPYFIKTVHDYSLEKLNDKKAPKSLRRQVKEVINNYKNRLPERVRKLQEENEAMQNITNIRKKG